MSAGVDLELAIEALERSKVDLVVTGYFRDELPLRGGAGRADWRMCGLISDQILAGRLRGDVGEALLVPTSGRLLARRVMALGLGERAKYRLQEVQRAVQDAVERAIALGALSMAMSPLGLAGEDFARCAGATIEGVSQGFGHRDRSLRVRFVVPESEMARATRAIHEAIGPQTAENIRFVPKNIQASQRPSSLNPAAGSRPSPR